MEQVLLALVKSLILPPGLFIVAFVVVALAAWRRRTRLAAVLGLLSAAGLWFFSCWAGAGLVASPLERPLMEKAALHNLTPEALAGAAQAIVVLAGGRDSGAPEFGADTVGESSLIRLRYGAFLHRYTGLPLMLSGGVVLGEHDSEAALMAEALRDSFGITPRWVEGNSRNTAENAMRSAEILKAAGIRRVLLVTHANHMPRSLAAFRATGIDPVPAPTRFILSLASDTPAFVDYLPDVKAALYARNALHERLGRLWYRLRYGIPD